jgi:hypothetical protein
MANTCYNLVQFVGSNLNPIKNALTHAIEVTKTGAGWIPDKDKPMRALFSIDILNYEDDLIIFTCDSKWAPPIDALEEIAKEAKVNFMCRYQELGGSLFGQYNYDASTEKLIDTCLSKEELATVTCNDFGEDIYEGEVVESKEEIYEGLLDDKLNALDLN